MKVTESQLKQIIKEELASVLEDKKHPGQTCEEAHPDIPHERWEARNLEESEMLDEGLFSMLKDAAPLIRNVVMYGPMIMGLVKMLKANPDLADKAKAASDPPATSAPDAKGSSDKGWEPGNGWLEEENLKNNEG